MRPSGIFVSRSRSVSGLLQTLWLIGVRIAPGAAPAHALQRRCLLRQRLRQHRESRLARGVGAEPAPCDAFVNGRHVQHDTAPLLHHALQRLACAQETAIQIDAQHALPRLWVGIPRQSARAVDACVVDERIDAAPLPIEFTEHRTDLRGIADIGLQPDGFRPRAAQFRQQGIGCFGVHDVVDRHARAAPGKRARDRGADAGVGPGDEDARAVERYFHDRIRRLETASVCRGLAQQFIPRRHCADIMRPLGAVGES